MRNAVYFRIDFIVKWRCTRHTAVWCRSWPRATIFARHFLLFAKHWPKPICAARMSQGLPIPPAPGSWARRWAPRAHIREPLPLVREALAEAHLRGADVTGVAYTAGPGLMGALLVGG